MVYEAAKMSPVDMVTAEIACLLSLSVCLIVQTLG